MVDVKKRIVEDIEETAGYHPPEVYSKLSFYSSYEDVTDSLSKDFIPVTGAKPNPKLFVVGVIPPSANVTGKLLDRSASVSAITGVSGVSIEGLPQGSLEPVGIPKGIVSPGGLVETKQTTPNMQAFADSLLRVMPGVTKKQAGVLWAQFAGETRGGNNCYGWNLGNVKYSGSGNYQVLAGTWEGFSPSKVSSLLESGLWVEDPDPGHAKAVGPGKVSLKVAPGKELQNKACWFATYPSLDDAMLSFIEKKRTGLYSSAWPFIESADPDGFARELGRRGYYTGSPDAYSKLLQVSYNSWVNSSAFEEAQRKNGISTEKGTTDWQKEGAANASKAKQENAKTQGKDLNTTELGRKFQAAQRAEVLATAQALEDMRNLPPLRFLVNPQSFKVSSEKVVSDGNWTRNGPVVEHWGDGQDKVEFSGKVAAFMAVDTNSPRSDNESGGSPGLTRVARNFTASYQNFMSLWMLYRNNAGVYIKSSSSDTPEAKLRQLSLVGSMYIYYDGILYIGSFDTFSITESDTSPHSLEYSAQFTVRATFVLDQAPDPRESASYGPEAQKFFSAPRALNTTKQPTFEGGPDQEPLRQSAEAQQGPLVGVDKTTGQVNVFGNLLR